MIRFDFYVELRCRLCTQTFCCIKCRLKHEVVKHNIDQECIICSSGKINIHTARNPAKRRHLEEAHLPMYCRLCFSTITSMEQLNEKSELCLKYLIIPIKTSERPLRKSMSNLKPAANLNVALQNPESQARALKELKNKFDSPEVLSVENPAVTSTPLSNAEAGICVPDNITPVDNENSRPEEKTSEKTTKKVSFFSTPAFSPDQVGKSRGKQQRPSFLKSCLKNAIRLNNEPTISEPTTLGGESEMHTAAGAEISNETLWMTALNNSMEMSSTEYPQIETIETENLQTVPNNNTEESVVSLYDAQTSIDLPTEKTGVWHSVAKMLKKVVGGFSTNSIPAPSGLKRSRSATDLNNDVEERILKRHKSSDAKIECRPPIRPKDVRIILRHDVGVQTDECEDDENANMN